jgi:hypothetical protein
MAMHLDDARVLVCAPDRWLLLALYHPCKHMFLWFVTVVESMPWSANCRRYRRFIAQFSPRVVLLNASHRLRRAREDSIWLRAQLPQDAVHCLSRHAVGE